jgi:hypothetical protein
MRFIFPQSNKRRITQLAYLGRHQAPHLICVWTISQNVLHTWSDLIKILVSDNESLIHPHGNAAELLLMTAS